MAEGCDTPLKNLIIQKGRLSIWMLIIATAVLAGFGKIDVKEVPNLFIWYAAFAVAGEGAVDLILSRIAGASPKSKVETPKLNKSEE